MRILLTGGAGDVGSLLARSLKAAGHEPVVLDLAPPRGGDALFVQGSILDREKLKEAMKGADMVVHIAAWHGIHEHEKTKDAYDFHDLNVTGTFNVFQAAADAGVRKAIFISSTSADDRYGLYGHTKVLGEEMARAYAHRHDMDVITLRPRAFIPSWNRTVYKSWTDWAKWFMRGAVHVADVEQAVLRSVGRLAPGQPPLPEKAPVLTVDGAYEYTAQDLAEWDKDGPGSTFRKYYAEHYDRAVAAGLDPAKKPKVLDIAKTREIIGYAPLYSLKSLLEELKLYGAEGPPGPFAAVEKRKGALRKLNS